MHVHRLPFVLMLLGMPLSACVTQRKMVTDSPGSVTAPQTAAVQQPAPPATTAPAAPAPVTAARAARAPTPPPEPDEEPMTITRAREQCWMQAEHQRQRDIDARVKFVEKCVAEKMK